MSTVTIAVDLAKNVFEIAVAGRAGTIRERKRLSRPQFEQFWGARPPCRVVMEACASSHFWARWLMAVKGHQVLRSLGTRTFAHPRLQDFLFSPF
jgi:transposase